MMKHFFRGVFLMLLLLNGASWADTVALTPPKGILPLNPRPAPALVLNDIDGNHFDLAKLLAEPPVNKKGRWVFVHFWASWCGPCRREMPAIQRMVEKLPERPFDLAIVNTAEDADTVFTFLGLLAPDLLPLMDSDGMATEAWEPRGLPSTYLVDPAGMIRFQALGGRPWDEPAYLRFLESLNSQP